MTEITDKRDMRQSFPGNANTGISPQKNQMAARLSGMKKAEAAASRQAKPPVRMGAKRRLSAWAGAVIAAGACLLVAGVLVLMTLFDLFGIRGFAYRILMMDEAARTYQGQLDARAALLDQRQADLDALQQAVDQAQQQLQKDQAALAKDRQAFQDTTYQTQQTGIRQAAAYYQVMDPAKCARILEEMDAAQAASILYAMEQTAAANVMAALDANFAAQVTQILIS